MHASSFPLAEFHQSANNALMLLYGHRYRRKSSKLRDTIRLDFFKGHNDNPKVCGIVLVYGNTSLAQSLVGIEPLEETVPAALASSDVAARDADLRIVDSVGAADGAVVSTRRDEDSEHPLPLSSMLLGGILLVTILIYETYFRAV